MQSGLEEKDQYSWLESCCALLFSVFSDQKKETIHVCFSPDIGVGNDLAQAVATSFQQYIPVIIQYA